MLRKIRLTLAVLCFAIVTLLYWDASHLVGLDGQNTVPSCAPGVKCGYCGGLRVGDTCLRTGVLFGHLSAGRDAGHHRLDGQKTEEEPLLLFSGQVMAAVWGVGSFRCSDDSRNRLTGGIARAIQFIRTDRKQSVHPIIRLGKQSARLLCGTRRQLRLL